MFLNRWTKKNHQLKNLIQQSHRWLALQQEVRRLLPRNLANFCYVACINEQQCLLLDVENNLVANRLRMILPNLVQELQSIDSNIQSIHVRIRPKLTPIPKNKNITISDDALDSFNQAAKKVSHHPRLSAALQQFAQKRQSSK